MGKDVVVEENLVESLDEFKNAFELFEKAVMEGNYNGMEEVIDTESLVNYFLFSEFAQNYDAYFTSIYFMRYR